MHPLFIDSLNAISSELESNAIHILTHPKRISEKIESFTMQLVEFKCSVLSLIRNLIRDQLTASSERKSKVDQIIEEVQTQLQSNKDRLHRYRLHQILKRKVEKQRKQSLLGSQLLNDNQSFLQMEKSIIMIEKDLGIQNESDSITERLGLSTVISRSLLAEGSPSKAYNNPDYSVVSEVSSIPHDTSLAEIQQIGNSLAFPKENLEVNFQESRQQAEIRSEKQAKPAKKMVATAKKSKKTVFSKMDSGRQGLLGNLLQQTYRSLDKN